MASYILTNKALEDLTNIWKYTFEEWSETQADKYYNLLLESLQELADGNITGKNYLEVHKDLWGLRIGQHIIFYRKIKLNEIEIARILHMRMDLKTGCRNKIQNSTTTTPPTKTTTTNF